MPFLDYVPRSEFDALKTELEALKEFLKAAKAYDERTGQPDCEDPDKVRLFRQLAALCGIDMSDIFPTIAIERPQSARSRNATPPGRKSKATAWNT